MIAAISRQPSQTNWSLERWHVINMSEMISGHPPLGDGSDEPSADAIRVLEILHADSERTGGEVETSRVDALLDKRGLDVRDRNLGVPPIGHV